MPAELSVVTLSKTAERLQPLTDSLDAQVGAPPFRRVLVDNGVAEYPAGFLKKWLALRMGYNSSFSEGNNTGVKAVRQAFPETTHVLLLNDDCRLEPDAIAKLWDCRAFAGILGMKLLHDDGTVNHAGARIWPRPQDHMGRGDPSGVHVGLEKVQAVTFASVLIRLDAWDAVGGFDEGYVYGFEDTDFCLKFVEQGGTIWCNRDAVGWHGECGTRARFQDSPRDQANARLFYGRWTDERVKAIYGRS
jgi:GT2 family glycosyltransferase